MGAPPHLGAPGLSDPLSELLPAQLPDPGEAERWPWLQRLRQQGVIELQPWVEAIETGSIVLDRQLLTVLIEHLDAAAACRLLAWAIPRAACDPAVPGLLLLIGRFRDPLCADLLRRHLSDPTDPMVVALLLPLLGHQRNPADFPLLSRTALDPGPLPVRRAALEALAVGLACWPLPDLEHTLEHLGTDLDRALASQAVDLLAHLPGGHGALQRLSGRELDPWLRSRLERRLRGYGRIGGQDC